MVDTNKILTVSYGTFSCTLEGFDDSFGTMKAIAEYFRDLAADDRYFGAEPPTPDAEMLARIAEREIARRVDAQIEDQNIHLRADPGSILPVAARAAETVAEDAPRAEEEPVAEAPAAEPIAAVEEPAVETEIEAAVPEAEVEVAEPEAEKAVEEAIAVAAEAPEIVAEEISEVAADDQGIDWPEDDAAEFFGTADEPASVFEPEAVPEVETEVETADDESVAAKLQRIRAVVSHETKPAADVFFSEDEHAEEFLADAHEDIEAALALDDQAEVARTADTEVEAEDKTDTVAELIGRIRAEDFSTAAEEDTGEDTAEAFLPTEEEDEFFEDLVDEVESDDITDEPDVEAEQEAAPLRARVIKMKRADFDAAIAAGEFEEEIAEDETEAEIDAEDVSDDAGLSAEDEADLLRELAAVEAEIEADVDTDLAEDAELEEVAEDETEHFAEFEDEDEDADAPIDLTAFVTAEDIDVEEVGADSIFAEDDYDESEVAEIEVDDASVTSPFETTDAEDDMTRMFDMADSQMDEEAGKGRRNAIAHLRAAVAAAKAEEGAGGKLRTQAPDSEVYRDDLDSVVRPRRPESGKKVHTRRPDAHRPAPLKLVAEQRIDLEEGDTHQSIRPRRVRLSSTEAADGPAEAGGEFAEYAENVGANSLPELLEAAAAYLSFVEGREQFSRPQLMTQISQVEHEDFSREDGLRSFGQLLRDGKIEKTDGGRFKASENISYRPNARYAGE